MKRDLQKYVEEYKSKFYGLRTGKGAIYGSDIDQIFKMVSNDFDRIGYALEAGFIIGYRLGKKEARK